MSNRIQKRDYRVGRDLCEEGLRWLAARRRSILETRDWGDGSGPSWWEVGYGLSILKERLLKARGREAVKRAAQAAWHNPLPKFSRTGE